MTDHKKYWVYIVASRAGALYIGMKKHLYVRVAQHKAGEIEGFSRKYHCNRLVYWESFDDSSRPSIEKSSSRDGGGRRSLF